MEGRFLNPVKNLHNILFVSKKSTVCLQMAFSRSFGSNGSSEIGL